MLKKIAFRKIMIVNLALVIILIVCLFPKKDEYKSIEYINSIKTPIYLIDSNNYVARVNILKNSNNVNENIKDIISSLTIGSKNSIYLPNEFKAIIPKDTKLLNFSIQDNLLKLNFSKEILNIEKENEEKLIESIIYSLTEINGIEKIMIFVEDEKLIYLPNSKVKLPDVLDRTFGINKVYDLTTLKNINSITTYYIGKTSLFDYYIPITEITNEETEKIEIIVNNLKNSPSYQTNLLSYLEASINLESYEILESTINVSFDNELIAGLSNKEISEEVQYTIFLSLKDSYNIKNLIIETPKEEVIVN